MKTKIPSKSVAIRWLKKHAIEIIAVIAAIIAAYYAYKTYKDSITPQLEIVINNRGKSINVDDIFLFENLLSPTKNNVYVLGSNCSNLISYDGIPCIVNNSSKSLKNFRLTISIDFIGICVDSCEIWDDYTIVERDSTNLTLQYKYDILYGHSAIPIPIRFVYHCPESEYDAPWMFLDYRIVYDGIKEPKNIWISNHFLLNNGNPIEYPDRQITQYLDDCYHYSFCFTNGRKISFVSIISTDDIIIIKPPKRMTDAKFEKLKKDIIRDFKKKREQ